MTDLGTFEGKDVIRTTIAVTNAGDGLSEALKVEPEIMHLGETKYVVLECEVAKVRHEPADKEDEENVARVHVLRAGTATIVDDALVRNAIDKQRDRIQRAKEAEEGIQRLDMLDAESA